MRPLPIAAMLTLLAAPALAETQLERMERVTEALQMKMFATMVEGSDIDLEQALAWDDPMRDAARCLLDAYAAEADPDALDTSFDAMEELLEGPDLPPEEMAARMNAIPQPVSQERSIELSRECGLVDLQMQRMTESGLMEAMMQGAQPN